MANEIQTARGKIKTKLDINDTTFDTMLLDCIEQAIPRLAPYVKYSLAEDTSVTLAAGADSFTMPNATSQLDRLYYRSNSTDVWRELDLWRQNRSTVYISEAFSSAVTLKVIAKRPYVNTDADVALLMVDSPAAMLPLYLYSMCEFATMVVGNKRKFSIYQQMNGVRTVAEMQDLANWYETRAERILENELSAEGQ